MSDSDLARRERALGIVWSTEFEVTPWSGPFEWTDGTEYPAPDEWSPATGRTHVMLVRGQNKVRQLIDSLSQDTRGGPGLRRLSLARCLRWMELSGQIAEPVVAASLARIPIVYGQHPAGNAMVFPGILHGVGERWLCVYVVGERWLVLSLAGDAFPSTVCGRCTVCASVVGGRQRGRA